MEEDTNEQNLKNLYRICTQCLHTPSSRQAKPIQKRVQTIANKYNSLSHTEYARRADSSNKYHKLGKCWKLIFFSFLFRTFYVYIWFAQRFHDRTSNEINKKKKQNKMTESIARISSDAFSFNENSPLTNARRWYRRRTENRFLALSRACGQMVCTERRRLCAGMCAVTVVFVYTMLFPHANWTSNSTKRLACVRACVCVWCVRQVSMRRNKFRACIHATAFGVSVPSNTEYCASQFWM